MLYITGLRPRYILGVVLLVHLTGATTRGDCPSEVRRLDPYPHDASEGLRWIPDFESGGSVALGFAGVIDIVILGDGFRCEDRDSFFDEAREWYDSLFDDDLGLFPYNRFAQAFRVRAVFRESTARVTSDRDSYYRLQAAANSIESDDDCDPCAAPCGTCDIDTIGGWWNDAGADNETFRAHLFAELDALSPAFNTLAYPADIASLTLNGDYTERERFEYYPPLCNTYSNVFVVMKYRGLKCVLNDEEQWCNNAGGVAKTVREHGGDAMSCAGDDRRVRVAFGVSYPHEFTHAFAHLIDEYIQSRGTDAGSYSSVPDSVFTAINVAFTDTPCEAPWAHLAPGSALNPDLGSPVGRLYRGGYCDTNVWHSEYRCLMNGTHENFQCNSDETGDGVGLRQPALCFWCAELVALRILEKSGQLARTGDPADINERGQVWYGLWSETLRGSYYEYFGLADAISEVNRCYEDGTCTSGIDCLAECNIGQFGNAVYVDSGAGLPWASGRRQEPVDSILRGVILANSRCGAPGLVAIKPGTYEDPLFLELPSILVVEACEPVLLGGTP